MKIINIILMVVMCICIGVNINTILNGWVFAGWVGIIMCVAALILNAAQLLR